MTAVPDFQLPDELVATAPPEATGRSRDDVAMLVARPGGMEHSRMPNLAGHLEPGDLVVVNTSATLAAAVDGERGDGRRVTVHFSTALDDGTWLVEIRARTRAGPLGDLNTGERVSLPDGVDVRLLSGYRGRRMWRARVDVDGGVITYLSRRGRPISYPYVPAHWPLSAYQTVFARDPGSAEMPSAGRPITADVVVSLVTAGVVIAPVLLHTGVSSLERGERPLPERYHVPEVTARLVDQTRAAGRRVVAVGTTVTRALESAAGADSAMTAGGGWTELVLGPDRPARVVGGLITGWHAPGASHLDLLVAVAGADLVATAYRAGLAGGYRWHEFGDSCLLLP